MYINKIKHRNEIISMKNYLIFTVFGFYKKNFKEKKNVFQSLKKNHPLIYYKNTPIIW